MAGNCDRQMSTAKSQACHIGCISKEVEQTSREVARKGENEKIQVGGRGGDDTGVQFAPRIIRSASKKLRNKLATSKSFDSNLVTRCKRSGSGFGCG